MSRTPAPLVDRCLIPETQRTRPGASCERPYSGETTVAQFVRARTRLVFARIVTTLKGARRLVE